MINKSEKQIPMRNQPAEERIGNFGEVALGYSNEEAVSEAKRCLGCRHRPCVSGCPVGINIPDFIEKIAEGKPEEAYEIISESSSLPAVCGRVCPQETQCEAKCARGIKGEAVAIGKLERFAAEACRNGISQIPAEKTGYKVAVIGSGPAGLTCAGELVKMGHDVTVFEALHTAGGVLVFGIPEFRLPKRIVKDEIEKLKNAGVKIETNTVVGRLFTIEELKDKYGFDAVFIGSGAGLPQFMDIPGENLNGVYSANEYLTRINLMKAYLEDSDTPVIKAEKVAVVGGGNVAMDAARCAVRMGAKEVSVIYRRSASELPARREEVEHAKEEGVIFRLLSNPKELLSDENGHVRAIKCMEMELGEPDESGRRKPVEKPDSEFIIETDCVIMAIGTSPNPLISGTTSGLKTEKRGNIEADASGMTSVEGVFAGGDIVTGSATVILAMGAGKTAAKSIDRYLKQKKEK